jgi:iron complex outermembrane receptor protein
MVKKLLFLIIFIPCISFSQKINISGNVSSSSDVLFGVSVMDKGTTNGTTTDIDGNYAITVTPNSILVFSYLGFKTKEVPVSGNTIIDVSLSEDASQLDEVTIKGFTGVIGQARRRAESIQSIPESVVTYTAKEIETKGITNIQSFSDQIPNVNFTTSQNIGNNFITVRGISHIRNGESPIAFVIDGVTLPDANLINQELFDVALIEVVKGPQGALYGKNAIAGAINIVTNQPTNVFKNKVNLGYSSGNLLKAQFSSNGPLIEDKLFYRVSGSYKKGDGFIDNETLNKPVDFVEDLTLRAQLKAILSEDIKATFTGQIIDAKAGAVYYAGPKAGTPVNFAPDDFNNQVISADQFGTSSLKGLYGNLKVEIGFENTKLVSSTTYNKGDRNHIGDLDFTAADVLRQIQDSNSKTFNQEFKLSSTDTSSNLSWDIGAFYQNSDKLLFTKATADFGFFAPPFAGTGVQSDFAESDFTNTFKTLAGFGFLDYKVSDMFSVSVGLRFDNDNISQDNRTLNTNPSRTDSQLQPKLSLALQATKNTMMYVNYGKGYRSGGFNQDITVRFGESYEPEITDSYELGIKNSYWNDRFILNLSTYYIDFSNQQQYALLIGGDGNIRIGNFNFDESESYGFEADFKLRPSKYFDIFASYGLSQSEIIKGTSTFSTGANESFDVEGKNTPLIPQDSFTLGIDSRFDVSETIAFNGNITLKGTGEIYWHEDNEAVSSSYNILNTRIGFTIKENTSISLWGNNILDTDYITEFFGQPFSNGGSDLAWKGNPATYGVGISYKF